MIAHFVFAFFLFSLTNFGVI
uniref:DUF3265 domain-containing protein n=1 Tax=Heterorhabditis bacteriophora TaxID=37862 RepID=A0A1I7WQL7_HETBA